MADVLLRKQKIEPGKTDRLAEWMADLKSAAREDEAEVQAIWDEEGLYTLSLFVERTGDADYLVWYVEAEDVERLAAVRERSTSPLHDLEDEMLADVLESPADVGDFEPLAHGVSRGRPSSFAFE